MILDTLSAILLICGAFFSVTGAVGLFKFPDFFTRVHAASVTDSVVTLLIVAGLMLRTNFDLVTVKLFIMAVFLLLTGPTASHALAKSARHGGLLTLPESKASDEQSKERGS
ncbi:MAG: sodium:proton antiporter [Gammaproteobacteria bacterium MedPE]|mgnify:CR=1 FL=1|nr:MAG: sodium:proton antiporter [Gammaproteobacteria bacterium MedPE]